MNSVQVTIRVHAHYVQTCVRFYGDSMLSYDEVARFGAGVPKAVFEVQDAGSLGDTMRDWKEEKYNVNYPYFPDFDGWLEIRYTIPDTEDFTNLNVEEARYVDVKRGGHDVGWAFQNAQFKRAIMLNILTATAEKNAVALIKILRTLTSTQP